MTNNNGPTPNTQAAMWMGGAVFLWSWEPLMVALVGVTVGPFAFLFWLYLVQVLLWFGYLILFHPILVRRRSNWLYILRQLRTRDGLLSVASCFNIFFFVWASIFIDTTLVTVIFAGHTILFVAFRQYQDKQRHEQRYGVITPQDWVLLGGAVLGIGLVTLSQTGGLVLEGSRSSIWIGLALAASSMVLNSWLAHRFKLGEDLYQFVASDLSLTSSARSVELASLFMVTMVHLLIGVVLAFVAVWVSGWGTMLSGESVGIAVVGAVNWLGAFAFRYANLETSNLGVNALQYIRPVLSLIWLFWFATATIHRTDWLIVGTATVVAANALINFRSEDRAGYRWLVLCLLGFGFVVYMRDDWFSSIPGYGWFPAFGDYYSMLGAGATLFILILAFRTSRLNARAKEEENQVLYLWRELSGLSTEEAKLLRHIRTADTTTDPSMLVKVYRRIDQLIRDAGTDGLSRSETVKLHITLDALVRSKQRGRNVAELIVLVMLALATTGVTLFARPAADAWPGMLNDLFSMLLASVIVFMTIHLFDQRRERDYGVLAEDGGGILFRDLERTAYRNLTVERRISAGIGFAVIIVYGYLMFTKWLIVSPGS